MNPYTCSEYVDMVCVLYEANGALTTARRIYQERYPNRTLPSNNTFVNVDRNLRENGSFEVNRRGQLGRPSTLARDSKRVLRDVYNNPTISVRKIAAKTEISKSIVHRQRKIFCEWVIGQQIQDFWFPKKIIFTDEAAFTRDGCMNLHNTHFWSSSNPHLKITNHYQHKFTVNVWCGILAMNYWDRSYFQKD